MLHRLPRLTFLDSSFVTAEERKEAQRIGAFMRVVRPSDSIVSTSVKLYSIISSLSLLPAICVNLALCVLSCLVCYRNLRRRINPQRISRLVSIPYLRVVML